MSNTSEPSDVELVSAHVNVSATDVDESPRESLAGHALHKYVMSSDSKVDNKTTLATDTRMVRLFAGAILCSTIYVIFPVLNGDGSTNYWAYYLAKEQWWSLFGNAGFVEMAEAGLPGSPLHIYVYSYMFGWFIPPILHILAYATGSVGNPILGTLAVTSSLIVTTALYVGWQLNVIRQQKQRGEGDLAAFRVSSADEGVTHDIFSAVMDSDNVADVMDDGRDTTGTRTSSLIVSLPTAHGSGAPPGSGGLAPKPAAISAFRAAWLKNRQRFKEDAKTIESKHASMKRRRFSAGRVSVANPLTEADPPEGADQLTPEENAEFADIMATAGAVSGFDAWLDEEEQGLAPPWWNVIPLWVERNHILPRFWYPNLGEVPGAHITAKNRPLHVLATVTFYFGWVVVYFILMQFTFGFRESDEKNRIYWFMFFTVASTCCKLCMKRIGLQIDRGKVGTCSMFFVGEFMCTLFYFTFYRMLFEDFVDWTTFTVLQALHLVMEWCLYCVRGTKLFYSFFKGLPDWTGSLKNVVIMRGLSHRDWQIFLTLDFALRAEIMLFSAPGFIIPLLVTGECYWVRSFLKPISIIHFEQVFLQIFIAGMLEIVNGYVMYVVFFKSQNLNVMKYSINCFSDARFCVVCFCISVCLFINPFAAFESYFLNFSFE